MSRSSPFGSGVCPQGYTSGRIDKRNRAMTNLVKLKISIDFLEGFGVFDIAPLSSLTKLTELDLSNLLIQDISPLRDLVQLTKLDISMADLLADDFPHLAELI
jgi:hypothetical protein